MSNHFHDLNHESGEDEKIKMEMESLSGETKVNEAMINKIPESSSPPKTNPLLVILLILLFLTLTALIVVILLPSKKKDTSSLPTPSAVPTSTSQSDKVATDSATADWKTYKNEKYGFEFKYPPNFLMDDSKLEIVTENKHIGFNIKGIDLRNSLHKDKGQAPRIYIQIVSKSKSIDEYVAEVNSSLGKDAVKIEKVKIGSIDATRVDRTQIPATGPNYKWRTYLFNKNNLLYILNAEYGAVYQDGSGSSEDEPKIVLDQILSTFKFTGTSANDERTILKNSELKGILGDKCGTDLKLNQEKANEWVDFSRNGISFKIPYNSSWGNEQYKLNPFDNYEGKFDASDDIYFGNLVLYEGCSIKRDYQLSFNVPMTKANFVKFVGQSAVEMCDMKETTINGREVVEYKEFCESKMPENHVVFLGTKNNYDFRSKSDLTEIVKTVKITDK